MTDINFPYERITMKTQGGVLIDLVSDSKYVKSDYYVYPEDIEMMKQLGIDGGVLTKDLAMQLLEQGILKRKKKCQETMETCSL